MYQRLIIFLLILSFSLNADAIEDGTYYINQNSNNSTNILSEPIILEEGQLLTFISGGASSDGGFSYSSILQTLDGSYVTNSISMQLKSSYSPYDPYPEDLRTLAGPLTITKISGGVNGDYVFKVKTIKKAPEFSVSLDNDGDRIAVGYKVDGTNAVVKVYAFDGSDWNQLGSEIE